MPTLNQLAIICIVAAVVSVVVVLLMHALGLGRYAVIAAAVSSSAAVVASMGAKHRQREG